MTESQAKLEQTFETFRNDQENNPTMWLVEKLVTLQMQGTIRSARYEGDGFKVTVTTKKKK